MRAIAALAPLDEGLMQRLQEAGYRVLKPDDADAARVEAAVIRGSLQVGEREFAALPRLRLLCCWGAGHDAVDLQAAGRRGVVVANSPGANSGSVADLAIQFVIALMRRVPEAERHLRDGRWQNAAVRLPPARGVAGSRLGVFGFGAVGRELARRAQALAMDVGACSPRRPDIAGVQAFERLAELAAWADVLVIAARADASTRHAVDESVLAALGSEGYLVNVARGSIIDEAALCRVLERRGLAGVACDVFEHEPAVPQALLAFPNAVLTPHIGGATQHARSRMDAMVLENLDTFFATGFPRFPVPAR